jgi:hypothetical protein
MLVEEGPRNWTQGRRRQRLGDPRAGWLRADFDAGLALACESDIVSVEAVDGPPPERVLVELRCTTLVRAGSGAILEARRVLLGVRFSSDYLRCVDRPQDVLTVLEPENIWHPNVLAPAICIGPIDAGTSIVHLIFRAYEVVTYQRFTPVEYNSLNPAACAWARANLQRFPVDPRPLRRRRLPTEGPQAVLR